MLTQLLHALVQCEPCLMEASRCGPERLCWSLLMMKKLGSRGPQRTEVEEEREGRADFVVASDAGVVPRESG